MAPLAYSIVDAFTPVAFAGNPAAVIIFSPDDPRVDNDNLYLQLAAEFNLSETAFLVRLDKGGDDDIRYSLRWFTPAVSPSIRFKEVKLCGHATLASANILFSKHHPTATTISFETRLGAGTLVARRQPGSSTKIQLDFPADLKTLQPVSEEVKAKFVQVAENAAKGAKGKVLEVRETENLGFVVELDQSVDLPNLEVDITVLTEQGGGLLTFTQRSPKAPHDIYSRLFAPKFGLPEDPVTGSAHCFLGTYWLGTPAFARLDAKCTESSTIFAKQVSARGGEIEVSWNRETNRVTLTGEAVVMMSGEVLV
ncbi:phenazine biosynthesis PhzC/PhzF protein [Meredithblackwellia eburnea MCA 4105]